MTPRIHGVPFRTLSTGERVPDCCRARCWINHVGARWLFWLVPHRWYYAEGWRLAAWRFAYANFGWWGYSHQRTEQANG